MATNFDELTIEQLEAELAARDVQCSAVRQEMKIITVILNKKQTEAAARAKLDAMSPAERDAFMKLLVPA